MKKTNLKKHHHRIVPVALIALAIPVAILIGFLFVANLLFHDEKPPDDSALRLPDITLTADQNAYTDVVKASTDFNNAVPNATQPYTDEKLDSMLNGGDWDEGYAVAQATKFTQARLDFATAANIEQYQGPEGAHPNSVNPNSFSEGIYNIRYVAKYVALEALRKSHGGDVTDGLIEAFDIIRLSHRMEQSQAILIEWLIGSATKQIGLSALRQIATQSKLTADQAKTTSQELEAYRDSTDGLVKAMKMEYAYTNANQPLFQHLGVLYDQFYFSSDQPNYRSATGRFISLLDDLGITHYYYWPNQNRRFGMENTNQLVALAQSDCVTGDMTAKYPPFRSQQTGFGRVFEPNAAGKFIADIGRISYGGILPKRCNESLAVSATQFKLAASAYLADTKGWPSKLDDLVPKYLPSVPLDPYTHQPFHYDNSTGIIYSIGSKRVDVGGSPVSADWQTQDNPSFSIR